MKVDDFDFELPRRHIALRPAEPRERARLLQVRQDGLADWTVADLPRLLRPGDLLVSNDTKVIPARLRGRRGLAGIEVTLLEAQGDGSWTAFARPAKKLHPGDIIHFAADFSATLLCRGDGGAVHLRFDRDDALLMAALEQHGRLPLPPYIKRGEGADQRDQSDYQTMFAARPGAVAAPTAGLHFTPGLLAALAARGISQVALTLHVGAGTFLPVTVPDTLQHRMHAEWGELDAATAARVNHTRQQGGRIVAVGSTATRLLETAAGDDGAVQPFRGRTDIFITPGYRFRTVDVMMTNFHLPRSTLFMLVAAFAGLERMQAAYRHAIAEDYRFYSYGDACLLDRGVAP